MVFWRILAIVALLGTFLVLPCWSFRTVAEWGQNPLAPPGTWVSSARSIYDPYHEPGFIDIEALGGQEITHVQATHFGQTLLRTDDGSWFVSGIIPIPIMDSTKRTYELARLNLSNTYLGDPNIDILEGRLASGWTGPYLQAVHFLCRNVSDYVVSLVIMPSIAEVNLNPVSLGEVNVAAFECNTIICVLLLDGVPFIYGDDSVYLFCLFGPNCLTLNNVTPQSVNTDWTDPPSWSATALALGFSHVVVQNGARQVITWGANDHYQLGPAYGDLNGSYVFTSDIVSLSAGHSHNLVLLADSTVHGWGATHRGQLGIVSTGQETPIQVMGLPSNVASVHGWVHTSMAITTEGYLFIWGSNAGGLAGVVVISDSWHRDGASGVFGVPHSVITHTATPFRLMPAQTQALGSSVVFRSIAPFHTCQTSSPEPTHEISCRIVALIDVDSAPTPTAPVHPVPDPVIANDYVVISLGGRFFTGNTDRPPVSPAVIPPVSIASLPRGISYDRAWVTPYVSYVREADSHSVWLWGRTMGQSPVSDEPIPPFISHPINTQADLSELRTIDHVALCSNAVAVVYGTAPSNLVIHNQFSDEPVVALSLAPSTIDDLICGDSVIYALLSNGTVFSASQDLTNHYPHLMGHDNAAGIMSDSAEMDVHLIAAAYGAFAMWYTNGSTTILATIGTDPLGYDGYDVRHPTAVNVAAIPAWTDILILDGCYDTFMAVLDTGDLIGWGGIPMSLGLAPDGFAHVVVNASHFGTGVTISQIFMIKELVYMLTSSGQLHVLGTEPNPEGAGAVWYPFQHPLQYSSVPVPLSIGTPGGMMYSITKLPRSTAIDVMDIESMAPILIAQAIQPAAPDPPLFEQSHQLMSFGHNRGDANYQMRKGGPEVFYLGSSDLYPFQPSPQLSFSDFQSAGRFPFNLSEATYAFSAVTAYALVGTDLWAWGATPLLAPIFGSPEFIEPTLVANDVQAIEAFDYGALVLRGNSSLQCITNEGFRDSTSMCGSNVGTVGIMFKDVGNANKFQHIACGTEMCVAYNTTEEWNPVNLWGNYWGSITFSLFGESFLLPNLTQIWVAGSPCLADAPLLHYLYSTDGVTQKFGYASMSGGYDLIYYAGITNDGVVKVATGAFHIMVLRDNGEIFGWGVNEQRQLSPEPVSVILEATRIYESLFFGGNVKDIGAVNMASLALLTDGSLYTWGADRPVPTFSAGFSPTMCTLPSLQDMCTTSMLAPEISCGEEPRRIVPDAKITRLFSAPASGGQNNQRYLTQFQPFMIAEIPDVTVPTSTNPISISPSDANQPQGTCSGSSPSTLATCTFLNGRWVWLITGSVVLRTSTPLDASEDIVIDGDLDVDEADALVIRFKGDGNLAQVNVTGCARLNQPITASVSEADVKRMDKADKISPQKVLECNCTQTSNTEALVTVKAPKSCRKTTATTEESQEGNRASLTTVFNVNSKSCNNWWIILVSVVGGILVLLGAFLIALAASPKLRGIILPYKGSN